MNFLTRAAQTILENHPQNLQNVLVLLPSKRGELFLKRALSKNLKNPQLAPAVQTIEEFVQEASGLHKQSQLQLIIELYGVYKTTQNSTETFDGFLKWGNMLLHDFNEIDRHLVNPEQLFSNLLDAKKLESWGLQPEAEKPELVANFLQFWKNLLPLYTHFQQELNAKKLSYQGKAYRKVAENLHSLNRLFTNKFTGIYLVGFSALNKAEETIFQHLISQHKAQPLWDTDQYYIADEQHEAGDFFRKYLRTWKTFDRNKLNWTFNNFGEIEKKIHIKSAPTKLGMAAAVGQILQELQPEDATSTAVVLADEAMLLPVLDAVPQKYNAINVTMGLPLKHAPIAQDVLAVLRLHEQAERTAASHGSYAFHHATFLAVVESALFKAQAGNISAQIVAEINARNSVFISPNNAAEILQKFNIDNPTWIQLFAQPSHALHLVNQLDEALKQQILTQENSPVHNQSAFALHQTNNQLVQLLEPLQEPIEIRTLHRLYQNILAEHQIDFYGEPLAGLQIMGMLETRTLDFKRVIITSLNEGILPAGKSQNSYIPHDLKRGFELPTHHEKDAVYAYHFYRLLQRAEEIWLIYDSDLSGIGVKEKSRFILQVQNELSAFKNIRVEPETHYAPNVSASSLVQTPYFVKNKDVLKRLRTLAEKGFSPSALSVYINDPARFYVERLLQVDDPEEVEENIGHDVLGNVVHAALQELYTPFVNRVLHEKDVQHMKSLAEKIVVAQLKTHYKGDTDFGRNLLIKDVAIRMAANELRADLARIKSLNKKNKHLTVSLLEQSLAHTCTIPGLDFAVTFKGIADRIDREGEMIYVLDYKTGNFEQADISVTKGIAHLFEPDKKSKAFQVLFYAWLFAKNFGIPEGGLQAGIFSTRKPSLGFSRAKVGKTTTITEDVLAEFETELFALIAELFNPTIPFAPRFVTLEETD